MTRVFLTIVVPLLLPTALYLLWLLRVAGRTRAASGLARAALDLAWRRPASCWPLTVLVVVGRFRRRRDGTYVPPHVENGRIVPGHVVPARRSREPAPRSHELTAALDAGPRRRAVLAALGHGNARFVGGPRARRAARIGRSATSTSRRRSPRRGDAAARRGRDQPVPTGHRARHGDGRRCRRAIRDHHAAPRCRDRSGGMRASRSPTIGPRMRRGATSP